MMIQPIVEGQGDVQAVPVLLRRLRDEAEAWGVEVGRPHRRHRGDLGRKDTLQRAVQVAALEENCSGILILFDADDDCPKASAPQFLAWAEEVAGGIPCAVVMANREYEAWLLASVEELRGIRSITEDATSHPQPEYPRDAKGALEQRMKPGASYSETVDQASLTAHIDLEKAYRASRSFRHLVKVFGTLAIAAGAQLPDWPPPAWLA